MSDPVLTLLVQKLRAKITTLTTFVANGSCSTFEEYKSKCAEIRSLNEQIGIVQDTAREYYKNQEPDDED